MQETMENARYTSGEEGEQFAPWMQALCDYLARHPGGLDLRFPRDIDQDGAVRPTTSAPQLNEAMVPGGIPPMPLNGYGNTGPSPSGMALMYQQWEGNQSVLPMGQHPADNLLSSGLPAFGGAVALDVYSDPPSSDMPAVYRQWEGNHFVLPMGQHPADNLTSSGMPAFDGVMALNDSNNTSPPSNGGRAVNVASMVAVQPGNVLVLQYPFNVHFPVVRDTVGTQGVMDSAARRRQSPPTYTCGICYAMFTTFDQSMFWDTTISNRSSVFARGSSLRGRISNVIAGKDGANSLIAQGNS